MVIKASAASEIRQLIEALGAEDDVRREAAIARLAVHRRARGGSTRRGVSSRPRPRERKSRSLRALEVARRPAHRRHRARGAIRTAATGGCGRGRARARCSNTARTGTAAERSTCSVGHRARSGARAPGAAGGVRGAQHIPAASAIASPRRCEADPEPGLKAAAHRAAARHRRRPTPSGRRAGRPAARRTGRARASCAHERGRRRPLGRAAEDDRCGARDRRIGAGRTAGADMACGARRAAPGAGAARQPGRGLRFARDDRGSPRTAAGLIPRRPARRRRRVVRRVTGGRVCAHAVRGRAVAAPAWRGVPRDQRAARRSRGGTRHSSGSPRDGPMLGASELAQRR